jgi:hypothetical protein
VAGRREYLVPNIDYPTPEIQAYAARMRTRVPEQENRRHGVVSLLLSQVLTVNNLAYRLADF